MTPPKEKRLLFLHTDNPTETRTRSPALDTKIRRHLMVDIGKSRRKAPKPPSFDTVAWQAEPSRTQSDGRAGDASRSPELHVEPVQASAAAVGRADLNAVVPSNNATPYAMSPAVQRLAVFEQEWGEDSFSAYGFALIMGAGNNALNPSRCSRANTFWFPFAFKTSPFLHHYEQIFTSPNVIIPLYQQSARDLRNLALQRSLTTIQCVEARLASPDIGWATADNVVRAVLAMACYNFIGLEFDKAMIHVKGLVKMVAARGGISTLQSSQDLVLMISWVDITAALLHDTKPLFPLPAAITSRISEPGLGLKMLPKPLMGLVINDRKLSKRFMGVMSCIRDLNELATLLKLEVAAKGDKVWDDEERTGAVINPVAHRLLNHRPTNISEQQTPQDIIAESLRRGAIIWIILPKRRCRSYPETIEKRISALLKMILARHIWNTSDLRLIHLWLLVLCVIGEPTAEDRDTAMTMIAREVRETWAGSWDVAMSDVRQMPWLDIFDPALMCYTWGAASE